MSDVTAVGPSPEADRVEVKKKKRSDTSLREWVAANNLTLGPIGALIILFIVFSLAAGSDFLSKDNMTNILAQSGVIAVMGTGLTFVLLLGEIDLAFAAIAVLAGIAGSLFYTGHDFPTWFFGDATFGKGSQFLSIFAALLLATSLGLLAGLMTAKVGVPSFIATLGLLLLCNGWAFYWAQGEIVYDAAPVVNTLGGEVVGPIPVIAIAAAVIMLIAHIVLSRTRFGRYIYMTGSNRRAAELAGVNTHRVIISVFMISGFLAGVAGLLAVGRLGSAQPAGSNDYLLPVIAATVVGGVSLFGGVGGIRATLVGVLVFAVLDNGLDQTDIDIHLKPFMRGLILLIAIVVNVAGLRIAARARMAEHVDDETVAVPPAEAKPADTKGGA